MKLNDLFKNVEHTVARECNAEILSVVSDNRKVEKGSLFICLRGLTVDGHSFAENAANAGAAAILAEKDFDFSSLPENTGVILVENTRRAMAFVAANFYGRPAEKLRLIGVTGTNGKTTTTSIIEEILRNCGRKTGLIGTTGISCNGKKLDIPFTTDTTPDPLELHLIFAEMLKRGVQDVSMEVSSHSLALFKMEGLTFDVGVFTNLTQDHLDFHGTMENYAKAKSQLFAQSRTAAVNADDTYTPIMLKPHGNNPVITYAIESPADFKALHTVCRASGSEFDLQFGKSGGALKFSLPLSGKFNIYNTLAAISVSQALGLGIESIRSAVAQLTGVPGRIQSVPNTRNLHVLIDYAHTPDGLQNIIKAVRESTPGRVITLFGCGGDRDKTKRPIMGKIAGDLSDHCILTSDNPRTEPPLSILQMIESGITQTPTPYQTIENRRTAIFTAIKMLTPQDALIIAGKGHEDYQIIGKTKHHFDDFETATEALEQ